MSAAEKLADIRRRHPRGYGQIDLDVEFLLGERDRFHKVLYDISRCQVHLSAGALVYAAADAIKEA